MNPLAALFIAAVMSFVAVGAASDGRDGQAVLFLVSAILFGAYGFTGLA
jgi:uncharacterized MAPEG superfamily protein